MNLLPGPQLCLIIIDGLGDRPYKKLRGRTPLEAARTPNMNKLARRGIVSYHYPLKPGQPVGSGIAHHLLFGYTPEEYPNRGVFEALGCNFKLEKGDLCFRVNFATLGNRDILLDRRAGRDDKYLDEITKSINKAFSRNPFKKKIELRHGAGHRGALVVKGWKRDVTIPNMDPQIEGLPIIFPTEKKELKLVKWLFETSRKIMKESEFNRRRRKQGLKEANAVLLRGAGLYHEVQALEKRIGLKAMGIATEALYLGAAKFAGMETRQIELDEQKIPEMIKELQNYDFFFIHFKKTDIYGHDGKVKEKKKEIEKIDKLLKVLFDIDRLAIAITGDHSTPCVLKTHSGDKVPVLFYGPGIPKDRIKKFGERYSSKTEIGPLHADDVVTMLANLAGRMPEVGQ